MLLCNLVAGWFRKLYELTKLPLVPLYGGFPVKLRLEINNCLSVPACIEKTLYNILVLHHHYSVLLGKTRKS